jgi:acetyltransferase-like isoleucine patch superfamily enzyme
VKVASRLLLYCYRWLTRFKNKCFSIAVGGAFAQFGNRSVLTLPIRIAGENRIEIGDRVFLGGGCWLQTLPDNDNQAVAISIGSGTSVAGACVISAVRNVRLEEDVLLARNVYISDHIHRYDQTDRPILSQGVDKVQPVLVKRGSWLGQNVVVCPGVTIGAGCVIGANSVVNRDIPDFSLAVGSPARVVRQIGSAVMKND